MDLKELLRQRAGKVTEARETLKRAETESRAMTPEEAADVDRLTGEAEALGEQIARRQRFAALEAQVGADGNRTGDPLPHQTEKRHEYSILRAIRCLMNHRQLDGLEGEVSQELQKRRGRGVQGNGFVLPLDLPMASKRAEKRSGFDTTAGAGGIPTILDTTYIDLLRNRMVVRQAGARVLSDMVGNFSIPRQSAAGSAYWVAEGGAPTGSNQTVDQVQFTPKTVGAYTDISRRLAEQLNADAEQFVRDDLAAIVARGVDLAALNGTGASNQPKGVLQTSGIGSVAVGTNGGSPTNAVIVGLETAVATANADLGALSYITNAKVRGTLKQTAKIGSTYPVFLMDDKGQVNGYNCFITNQLPSSLTKGTGTGLSPLVYGNWNDLVIAFWSGLDVIVDPYTGSNAGTVRIVTLQDCDVNLRHPESFAACVDIATL
jgi:HK97 family phage major capsid protein